MTDISPTKSSAKKSLGEYINTFDRTLKLPLQIKLYAYDALLVQLATRLKRQQCQINAVVLGTSTQQLHCPLPQGKGQWEC